MYLREIQTLKNRVKDEMPYAVKMLPGKKLDRLMRGYNDQMTLEVSTALHKNREKLDSLPYLERLKETGMIARQTREIAQDQYLQELLAKYQPITE